MTRESSSKPGDHNTFSNHRREVRPQRLTAEAIGLGAVRQVIDDFYDRAREDAVSGPRFSGVSDWSEHKAQLTHFWWMALGGLGYAPYRYRVVEKHQIVDVRCEEIDHWLVLFENCVLENVPGSLAEGWLRRARAMGESLTLSVAGG